MRSPIQEGKLPGGSEQMSRSTLNSATRQGRVFQRVGIPFQKAGQPLDRELWVGGGNPKD